MGILKDTKDALKALVEAAVPTGTAVLVGVDPAHVDVQRYPKFAVIVLERWEYQPNLTLMAVTQWQVWDWAIYTYAGAAGTNEDAVDEIDPLITAVVGLAGETITDYAKPIEIRQAAEFYAMHEGSPVYNTMITHEQQPSS